MKGWKMILVGTDFSAGARRAVDSAAALAAADTAIELVHVVEPASTGYRMLVAAAGAPDPMGIWREAGEAQMAAAVDRLRRPRRRVRGSVRVGKPWHEILLAAREVGADLICLGESGHSRLERLVLGSTAENVVRRSAAPVLVVREKSLRRVRRVVLPVDFDDGSRMAARFVREWLPRGARVDALHVVPPPLPFDLDRVAYLANEPEGVEGEMRRFLKKAGLSQVRVDTNLFGDPAAEILSFAKGADLIVLATHGRTGAVRTLLGSVAEKVVRHAPCPVLVLPMGEDGATKPVRKRATRAAAPVGRARNAPTRRKVPVRGAPRRPWNPQSQPGRGGPAGRRGGGSGGGRGGGARG